MEHEHSILYEPFNRWIGRPIFGFDVPDHVVMALLVLLISSIIFPMVAHVAALDPDTAAIGLFGCILSLGMRLFGNIFGEHSVTGMFMGMLPFVVPWPMMGLGIFGAVLQTFVFVMLLMVYIGGAVATEEH